MKFSAALLATALFASSVRGQEPDLNRLGLSVKDPVIVERVGAEITVGFLTGPNLPKTQFTIKCVDAGEDCDAPARGNSVEGFLPMTKTQIVETVDGLDENTDYTCYVETFFRENGKFSVCKEAQVLPGAVGFQFSYNLFDSADDFTVANRDQFCDNLKQLDPKLEDLLDCEIISVRTGSALVRGEAVFEDYQNAARLFKVLEEKTKTEEGQQFISDTMAEDIEPEGGFNGDTLPVTLDPDDLTLNAPGPYRYKDVPNGNRRLNRKRLML